jgi:hypothetical protein
MHIKDETFDFSGLDDPTFLTARACLREQLENGPSNAPDRAGMERRYEAMNDEFDRRATAAWTASQ